MDKQNLRPQPAQPIHRSTTGQLPPGLAGLSEETLSLVGADAPGGVMPASHSACTIYPACSYDGDDTE